jgi:hypothetical protein
MDASASTTCFKWATLWAPGLDKGTLMRHSFTHTIPSHLLQIQCVFEPAVYMYYVGACCRVGRIDTPTPLRLRIGLSKDINS